MRYTFLLLITLLLGCGTEAQVPRSGIPNLTNPTTNPDVGPPTVVITKNVSVVDGSFTVTFTWSEVVSGFISSDVTLGYCTIGSLSTGDNIVFTATATPNYLNDVTFYIGPGVCTDQSGNPNNASSTVTAPLDYPSWSNTSYSWTKYRKMRALLAGVTTQTSTISYYDGAVSPAMKLEGAVNLANGKTTGTPTGGGGFTFDPSNNTYVSFSANGGYLGGVKAPNGKSYFFGFTTNAIGVYDESNGNFYKMTSSIGALTDFLGLGTYYNGATLAYTGTQVVIVAISYGSGNILVLHPTSAQGSTTDDVWYTIGDGDSRLQAKFVGLGLDATGKPTGCPFSNTYIPVVDPTVVDGSGHLTNSSISFPYPQVQTTGTKGWQGSHTGLDSMQYFFPYGRASCLQLNPYNHTVSEFGQATLAGMANAAWGGAFMKLNGDFFSFPQNETRSLTVHPDASAPTVTLTSGFSATPSKNIGQVIMWDGRGIAMPFQAYDNGTSNRNHFVTYGNSQGTLTQQIPLSPYNNIY